MRPKHIIFAAALGLALGPARADISSDLNGFFNSIGLNANVTPGGAYKGQTAGYYTGGNLFARAPTRTYNLMSIQTPRMRAGCGGIDLFTGGFSFIDSDQLVAAMRNIGSNASGLAFKLALSTISPKLDGLINDMQNMANAINNASINSCEAAANLLGATLPHTEASNKALCQNIGSGSLFGSYASARQECAAGGQQTTALAAARANPEYKELLVDGNITWRALKKLSLTSGDRQLAEMVMSLTGTVVYPIGTDPNVPISPQLVPPPLLFSDDDLRAFLRGGEVEILKCQDGTGEFECLDVKNTMVDIPASRGFAKRVSDILAGMINRMYTEEGLTNDQLNLLKETSLPVYKMLNVATAYSSAYADTWKETYADAIALDLLYQYFSTLTAAVEQGARQLQLPEKIGEQFREQVRESRVRLERAHSSKLTQVNQTIQMMQESMTIERMLVSGMSPGLAGSFQWAKGLR